MLCLIYCFFILLIYSFSSPFFLRGGSRSNSYRETWNHRRNRAEAKGAISPQNFKHIL